MSIGACPLLAGACVIACSDANAVDALWYSKISDLICPYVVIDPACSCRCCCSGPFVSLSMAILTLSGSVASLPLSYLCGLKLPRGVAFFKLLFVELWLESFVTPDTSCTYWHREPDVELAPGLVSSARCMLCADCCCSVVACVDEDVVEIAAKLLRVFCSGCVWCCCFEVIVVRRVCCCGF